MTDFELRSQSIHHIIVEVLGIVSYDGLRQPIPTYDIVSDESRHPRLCQVYPFGEIIDGHKKESMTIRCFRIDHANDINTPH